MLLRVKPFSIALNTIQKDSGNIVETVNVWKKLKTDIKKSMFLIVARHLL